MDEVMGLVHESILERGIGRVCEAVAELEHLVARQPVEALVLFAVPTSRSFQRVEGLVLLSPAPMNPALDAPEGRRATHRQGFRRCEVDPCGVQPGHCGDALQGGGHICEYVLLTQQYPAA